jgi:hypothetical protein
MKRASTYRNRRFTGINHLNNKKESLEEIYLSSNFKTMYLWWMIVVMSTQDRTTNGIDLKTFSCSLKWNRKHWWNRSCLLTNIGEWISRIILRWKSICWISLCSTKWWDCFCWNIKKINRSNVFLFKPVCIRVEFNWLNFCWVSDDDNICRW